MISDLCGQVVHFKSTGGNPISVGLVGINFSSTYTSFEGERSFPTDGKKYKHPSQEAEQAVERLNAKARSAFDEFLILRFRATNASPYTSFEWVDAAKTEMEYSSLLIRVSRLYDERFRQIVH